MAFDPLLSLKGDGDACTTVMKCPRKTRQPEGEKPRWRACNGRFFAGRALRNLSEYLSLYRNDKLDRWDLKKGG
jgi:hypothetical protein